MRKRTQTRTATLDIPDDMLVSQSLNNDERAFELLFHRYSSTIFKFIYRYFGDYDLACDVMQQVFLQLYLSLPKLDTKRPLKNWLFQVARNRCLDELRKKRLIHLSELESEEDDEEKSALYMIRDPRPLPDELSEQHEQRSYLLNAIQGLPPNFRSVVYLRYTSQMSFSEIGKKLGIPETTAKTHFHRARQLLRASLAQ